ncbi:MAG: STAS domain-containing protein [Oscillochloris sp.]|nr:STAS domain-containing protein [Oscillochloris sp.]
MPGTYRLFRAFVMRHTDEDLRRRGQNLLIILWGLLSLTLISLPVTLINYRVGPLINSIIALLAGSWLIFLTHRGWVDVVAMIVLVITTVSLVLVPLFGSEGFTTSAYYFIVNIMIAGVVMSPVAIWATTAGNLVALVVTALLIRDIPPQAPSLLTTSVNAGILQAFTTLIAIVSATTTARALYMAQKARAETQRANQALAENNASLECQVADRTAALRTALADSEAQTLAFQSALSAQEQLNALISELSLPVIPINTETLVVPLVGALDSSRASLLLQRVLGQIESRRARTLILDVTGLPIIDTQVAKALINAAQTARLLGAKATLVGIRPEVAQALVSLGIELSDLQTYATLEQALDAHVISGQRYLA